MAYDITCPFCFNTFKPNDVHFRSTDERDDMQEQDARYNEYRERFFGETNHLPRRKAITEMDESKLVRKNGIPYSYKESDLTETDNRICPICHNPLPENSGFCEQKMISFVGHTQSGKTVLFLSIMNSITNMSINCDDVSIRISVDRFFDASAGGESGANMEYYGSRLNDFRLQPCLLPKPTEIMGNKRMPPIVYDVTVRRGREEKNYVICMFDMPGELLDNIGTLDVAASQLKASDATIFIVDPLGFPGVTADTTAAVVDEAELAERAKRVGQLAANMELAWGLAHRGDRDKPGFRYPFAVAISKSDTIENAVAGGVRGMIAEGAESRAFKHSNHSAGFDGNDINLVSTVCIDYLEKAGRSDIYKFARSIADDVKFFMLSALGGMPYLDDVDGRKKIENLNARRIADPLLWILYRFGIIPTNKNIRKRKTLFGRNR